MEEQAEGRKQAIRLVGELSRLFKYEMRCACGESGIRVGYRELLFYLARQDGQTQKELAEKTRLTPATVSITVEKMERDGLLVREKDSRDGRALRVYLTEKGKETDFQIRKSISVLERRFSALMTPEEEKQLAALLEKVIVNYHAQNGGERWLASAEKNVGENEVYDSKEENV